MKQRIYFPKCEGLYNEQAHVKIPSGLYEREHGRDGFFGAASHFLHKHKPTDWIDWQGPLQPHALDLNNLPSNEACPWSAVLVMRNSHVQVRYWKVDRPMLTLARNSDGDELL